MLSGVLYIHIIFNVYLTELTFNLLLYFVVIVADNPTRHKFNTSSLSSIGIHHSKFELKTIVDRLTNVQGQRHSGRRVFGRRWLHCKSRTHSR